MKRMGVLAVIMVAGRLLVRSLLRSAAHTGSRDLIMAITLLIVVGIGLTAPPVGLNVFVISAIARDVPIARTYRSVLPFIAADIVRLALVLVFPGLALGLVRLFA